ncbi:MAG: phosphotransacetylase family protein, partial [Spirulinaceae cyanobacterium]
LLIGSIEAYSGKSATIVGMAKQLKSKGVEIAYGKPLGTYLSQDYTDFVEEDVQFMVKALNLPEGQIRSPLLCQDADTIEKRLVGKGATDYTASLKQYVKELNADAIVLEGPGNLWEGNLFNLSLLQISQSLDASILLVVRFQEQNLVDSLLAAKRHLGDSLLGVLLNDIPSNELDKTQDLIQPFLEEQGISVLGLLPRSSLLRSVSVRELKQQLDAKVLCREDRLDLMVESLTIGAMNVNSALEYFRKRRNMVVITGGDRSDLQLAALETSTNCLILTGNVPPQDFVLSRAEDLEVPILSVDQDTLTAVEIADRAFGQVRFQEPIKVECIQNLMEEHFDVERLLDKLGIE